MHVILYWIYSTNSVMNYFGVRVSDDLPQFSRIIHNTNKE